MGTNRYNKPLVQSYIFKIERGFAATDDFGYYGANGDAGPNANENDLGEL